MTSDILLTLGFWKAPPSPLGLEWSESGRIWLYGAKRRMDSNFLQKP